MINKIRKLPTLPMLKKGSKPVAKSPPSKDVDLKAMLGDEAKRRLLKNK